MFDRDKFKIGVDGIRVRYYHDRDEELLFKRVLRICDDTQDFSVIMYPSAFDKFMKAMKNCN